jgi:FSR family fosmidomycin resistance protein-like MFS transporter
MDLDPARHEQLMARWTLAGSVGVVAGPVLLGAAVWLGAGWRGLFLAFVGLMLAVTLVTWRQPRLRRYAGTHEGTVRLGLVDGLRRALAALRQPQVLRWLILLDLSDLLLDVLLGFLALYFVDVVGASPALAGTAVAVRSAVGLLGDALVIPVLDRVPTLRYLRLSILAVCLLFPAFLLAPSYPAKLVLLSALSLATAGWYPILQGRLYSALPGQSGIAMAVGSVWLVGGLVPLALGWVAERFGLPVTMWLLVLGPLGLLIGLPSDKGQLTSKTSVL